MHGNERTATDPTKEAQQEEEKKQALDEVLPETVVIDGKEVTKKISWIRSRTTPPCNQS